MDLVTLILFIIGFILLVWGAELLVRGASSLAIAIGISPLVVGLTIVAYGTSAPELAVTVQATYAGQGDIALGNVVGSNIANILLVLGLSAIVAALIVDKKLLRLEIPLMIGLSFLVLFMGQDGLISRFDGIILFSGAVIYTVFILRQSLRETKKTQEEYAQEFDLDQTGVKGSRQMAMQVGLVVIGMAMIMFGSIWLIDGAVALARWMGVSELVIGLTIIAIGTSLPEVVTSVIASFRNERDIAVGNVVGSNLFNILAVLGLCSIVAPAGVTVSPIALQFDIPFMIAVAITTLPVFFTRYRIDRWEGALFLGYYSAYTLYLYLQATGHEAFTPFSSLMSLFIVPVTIIILIVTTVRQIYRDRQVVQNNPL